jgi:hypothetical protein
MKKLVIFLALLVAAYYVATHYFGVVGPKMVSNAKEAEQVLQ